MFALHVHLSGLEIRLQKGTAKISKMPSKHFAVGTTSDFGPTVRIRVGYFLSGWSDVGPIFPSKTS